MQSNYLLVPWKQVEAREAPARLLTFQCQPHTAVHIVSLILWNMYFVLFSDLFADKANVSCRLPPSWALTEWGLVATSPPCLAHITSGHWSVTSVILQSSCIINVVMLLPHKQLDNSMVLLRHKPTWVLQFVKLYYSCTVSWHLTVHFSLYSFLFSCLTLLIKNFFCIFRRVPWFNFQQSHWNIAK